jgi:hypothetical protein
VDVFTLTPYESGALYAGSSDFSRTSEWYMGRRPFAGRVDGRDACFILPPGGIGEDVRVFTTRRGESDGHDLIGYGLGGLLPTRGRLGWAPECLEQGLVHQPLVLEGVEESFSTDWVTACFAASDDDLDILDAFLDEVADEEGVADAAIHFTLIEEGRAATQDRPLEVWLEEDRLYLRFPVGLRAYGRHVLTEVAIEPTGSRLLDEMFDAAAASIGRWLAPTVVDEAEGRMQGAGPCSGRPAVV